MKHTWLITLALFAVIAAAGEGRPEPERGLLFDK